MRGRKAGLLVLGGVAVAAVALVAAIGLGVSAAPRPDPKAASWAYYEQLRIEGARHLQPKGKAVPPPPDTQTVALPAGAVAAGGGFIETQNPGPPGDVDFALANAWVDWPAAPTIIVWAGASARTPTTGRVMIDRYDALGRLVAERQWSLVGVGRIQVTGASGSTLTLSTGNGGTVTLDCQSLSLR